MQQIEKDLKRGNNIAIIVSLLIIAGLILIYALT